MALATNGTHGRSGRTLCLRLDARTSWLERTAAADLLELAGRDGLKMSRAVLPRMRERGSGLIVHVTSIVGRILFPACAFYCASKFALEAYAEVLHYEVTGLGIDSVLVEPGPYPTQLLSNSPGPLDEDRARGYGQLATVCDLFIGKFANFFASDEAPNPQENADAILKLISTPSGERPLRTVCGVDYGAAQLDRLSAPIQAQVLRDIGMGMLAPRAHQENG